MSDSEGRMFPVVFPDVRPVTFTESEKAPFPGPSLVGACEIRTRDLRLAKPALSQLS
jgi:hypothetical protein